MNKTYMRAEDKNVGCITLYYNSDTPDGESFIFYDPEHTKPVEKMSDIVTPFNRGVRINVSVSMVLNDGDIVTVVAPIEYYMHSTFPDGTVYEVLGLREDAGFEVIYAFNDVIGVDITNQESLRMITPFITPQSASSDYAILHKLYFDGAEIFRSMADFEEYKTMTFDEIYDLCYQEKNFVYIGDGQMKYYPQLDLKGIPRKPESITFMSTAQLDGRNFHTRIIITADNQVKTDQVIDVPMSEINDIVDARIAAWAAEKGL